MSSKRSKTITRPVKSSSSESALDTPSNDTTDTFILPPLPAHKATSNTEIHERWGGASTMSDFYSEPEVFALSSQPVEDVVGWQATQIPSMLALQSEGQSVKTHTIRSTVFHDPPPPTPALESANTTTNHRHTRMRPPLTEVGKFRNGGRRSSEGGSDANKNTDSFMSSFKDLLEKASKDLDKQNSILRMNAAKKLQEKGKLKGKTEGRKTWCPNGVVGGRVQKRTSSATSVDRIGKGSNMSRKGKEVDRSLPGPAMDVDMEEDRSMMAMDLDEPQAARHEEFELPVLPPRHESPSVEVLSPLPPERPHVSPQLSTRPRASETGEARPSNRRTRDEAIKRALSFGREGSCPAEDSPIKPDSSSSPSASGMVPPASSSSGSSTTLSSSSFSFDSSGGFRRSLSAQTEYDSIYGSVVPKPQPLHASQTASKERRATVTEGPSPSPYTVPGLINSKRVVEEVDLKQVVAQPRPQDMKRGPPMLGMRRRPNLQSASASSSTQPRGFRAPLKRTQSAGTRQDNIRRALEEHSASPKQEPDDGPDIHEGNADSSNYSALDISMDSDMADELNKIEQRLTQE